MQETPKPQLGKIRKETPQKHITVKILNIQNKQNVLIAVREKKITSHKKRKTRLKSDLSLKTVFDCVCNLDHAAAFEKQDIKFLRFTR